MTSGLDRFQIDFNKRYKPYEKQALFHASTKTYNFLGGAAGPGKTACGIVEHMMACNEFNIDDAPHVTTLFVRRTNPKLEDTVIKRFMELIPRELYAKFNETKKVVTWHNGATTKFASMQYESDAYMQGQWYKIFFDEMCEFTFKQWNAISPWNRCPVSDNSTKDGAGNPIGIGSPWVRALFVDKKPYVEMDDAQKAMYNPNDYGYFPCTYLDNPIYANNPTFIASLMSLPQAIREAMMNGSWDVVGGYFVGAFDSAVNVCDPSECQPKYWHRRWISGDWGFAHKSAIYWHYMDDFGVLRTYKELVVDKHDAEMLAEAIIRESVDEDGKMPKFLAFPFSHDAFASKETATMGMNATPVAARMSQILKPYGIPSPVSAGKDKLGREQQMYNMLRRTIPSGERDGQPHMVPNWIVSANCPDLIQCLGTAPRDEKRPEHIAQYIGDDPLQGAGYGIYHIFGKPADKPLAIQAVELWNAHPESSMHDNVMRRIAFDAKANRKHQRRSSWAR